MTAFVNSVSEQQPYSSGIYLFTTAVGISKGWNKQGVEVG